MRDLSTVRPDDFEPHRDTAFSLHGPAGELALKLVEVQRLGAALREGGAFSLIFKSAPGPALPQAIYSIAHPSVGALDLFVVPLGQKPGGNEYQVIFT